MHSLGLAHRWYLADQILPSFIEASGHNVWNRNVWKAVFWSGSSFCASSRNPGNWFDLFSFSVGGGRVAVHRINCLPLLSKGSETPAVFKQTENEGFFWQSGTKKRMAEEVLWPKPQFPSKFHHVTLKLNFRRSATGWKILWGCLDQDLLGLKASKKAHELWTLQVNDGLEDSWQCPTFTA